MRTADQRFAFQTANALIKNTCAWTSTDRELQLGTQVCIAQLTDFITRLESNPSAFNCPESGQKCLDLMQIS
ncbi:hypothetical protein CEXT_402991 [Caerostris extrusa]|uniref:Uncharacterized protein n=1 Tax=Caerostris extrusa TaxID=172846 RepID=A0AAV4UJR8_CAEEX|nr:hypothetical protein CEXT_402991 [Caerostris extrusa]